MTELTKKQVAAIKSVGRVCGLSLSIHPIVRYVFSDGLNVYGTNASILLITRDIGAPKGAYFPKNAETADSMLFFTGVSLDDILTNLHRCEKENTAESETHATFLRAKYAFDVEYKKELYQITFSNDGHFQKEMFFLKSLIKKAVAFVGKGFSLYQSEFEEKCVFESKDGKRIAIVMGWYQTYGIELLNDVDLK